MLRMLRSAVFIVPMIRAACRQLERCRVLKLDRFLAVLEQVQQLAKYARDIRAIQLVNDQHVVFAAEPQLSGHLEHYAVHSLEGHRAIFDDRPQPLHELLVSVARVELDDARPRGWSWVMYRARAFATHVLPVPGGPARITCPFPSLGSKADKTSSSCSCGHSVSLTSHSIVSSAGGGGGGGVKLAREQLVDLERIGLVAEGTWRPRRFWVVCKHQLLLRPAVG